MASTTGAATTPQAWIAGGIGVTPVSLIRAIDGSLDRDVQFFYSTAHAAEALHSAEIDAAASAHGSLHVHHVSSDTDGRLKADRVMRALRAGASPWIYMCGPAPMMRSLTEGFPRFPVTCHVGTRFVPTLFPPSLRRVWDHEVAGANLAAGPSGVPGLTG